MNLTKEQREELLVKCAEAEGIEADYPNLRVSKYPMMYVPSVGMVSIPKYQTDHNAMQRLIVGLTDDEVSDYEEHLQRMLSDYDDYCFTWRTHKATCEQKFLAYCMTRGWIKKEAGE